MSTSDGLKANASTFNNAYLSRTTDSDTIGVVGLNNTTDVNSGAQVLNTQRAINKLFDSDGTANEADGNAKNYANTNFIVDGDSRKVAIERLDAQLLLTNDEANSLRTLSGTSAGDDDLGTFTGSTITDNVDIKVALQELETEVELKIDLTEKGANNGVATLDSGGKVPVSQLPSSVMEYKGVWNASTNTPTLVDGVGDAGDVYRVSVAGTQDLGSGSVSYVVGDFVIYDGSIWQKSASTDAVVTVNGQSGVVVLDTDDISEGATNLYFTNARADGRIAAASIDDLADVDTSTVAPVDGDVLTWNNANSEWEPQAPSAGGAIVPHITIYTSGSGTFTPNGSTVWMKVRMVGGGGGGAGGGVNGTAGSGTAGAASTFGSITAGAGDPGNAGASNGGLGGTNSGVSSGVSITGGRGGAHLYYTNGGLDIGGGGGTGGANPFGGAGMAGSAGGGPATGGAGTANTGAGGGGGGAGSSGASVMRSGAGGGAGGYIEEFFTSIAGSYSYAVGGGGSGGAAGTSGGPGGDGAAGIIIIEEYY